MRKAKQILEALNNINEINVTAQDVTMAKERFEKQLELTTGLIEKVSGNAELQERAYDNVTAQLKAMDKFLQDLCKESVGE